ncbi:redoxin domain-containing protein [Chitinophaga deserti]|uniref:redoxin domain-containing protein n=1 Tax=Chitinophaga deserti TaxID=2164099 RepID=UPI0013006FFF|nr:redoxin domain-containing protein [Chitinophaga deserti]
MLCSAFASAADTLRLPVARLRTLHGAGGEFKAGKEGTVVVLLAPDCPLCKNYAPVLRELHTRFPGVKVYGIVPGKVYNAAVVADFARKYDIPFPLLQDPALSVTRSLQGIATPEAFYFASNGALVYRGMIDNRMVSLGKKRRLVTEKFLEDAIARNRTGLTVVTRRTEPIGCLINDY